MDFTYSDGTWNPEKHAYENGGWKTKTPDSNQISVENKGETGVDVTFSYLPINSAVSGSFTDNAASLSQALCAFLRRKQEMPG